MNENDLKFDNVYQLEAVMRIFEKTAQTSIMGSEPSRMRNRYGWSVYNPFLKLAFLRREIKVTALLMDGVEANRLPRPYAMSMWPGWVRAFTPDEQFGTLLASVEAAPLPRYNRTLVEDTELRARWPRGLRITDFWSVEQMADSIGISRESVYKRSDIRRGKGHGLKTVEYGGIHLWYPLKSPETAKTAV